MAHLLLWFKGDVITVPRSQSRELIRSEWQRPLAFCDGLVPEVIPQLWLWEQKYDR